MKLCPICEHRISANWCKSCFKFVTPWELNDGIHINERHSQNIDLNCDYHNPKVKYAQLEYMKPGYEEKIYGNASNASMAVVKKRQVQNSARNATAQRSNPSGRKTGKKNSIATRLAIGYVIFIVMASILPIVFSFIEESNLSHYNEYDDNFGDGDNYDYLDVITPIDTESGTYDDYKYTYYYYNVADLKLVGHNCDESHMEMYYQELLSLIGKVYEGYHFESYVDDDYYNNYLLKSGSNSYTYFETYAMMENEEFGIEVSYDSSTEQVHYYLLYADGFNETFMKEIYKWLQVVTPKICGSYEDFVEVAKEVESSGESMYLEYDDMYVSLEKYDDYVLIAFESVYY